MKRTHETRASGKVSEPVQVYLARDDRDRLERLTGRLAATKSDVLRRGLEALERELTDPDHHPALKVIGVAEGYQRKPAPGYDVAKQHDRFLAERKAATWTRARRGKPGS